MSGIIDEVIWEICDAEYGRIVSVRADKVESVTPFGDVKLLV